MRYDIDMVGQTDEFADKMVNAVIDASIEHFNDVYYVPDSYKCVSRELKQTSYCIDRQNFSVYESNGIKDGKYKHSFHILCNYPYFSNHREVGEFCSKVDSMLPDEMRGYIDLGIYSNNHGLRCAGSHKVGSDRVKT